MKTYSHPLLAAILMFAASVSAFAVEAVLKPLPTPDVSKLTAAGQKELGKARHDFDEAKPSLIGEGLAEAYAKIGSEYVRFGFNDVAALAFYNAAQLSPYDGRWPYLQGVMAMSKKQNTQARDFFQAALALDQAYLPIRFRLADVLVDIGDLDGAKKLMDELLKSRQDLAPSYALLGEIALKQKRYPEAIENLNHALKIEPQADHLYALLADVYTAQGNEKAAKEAKALAGSAQPTLVDPLVSGMHGAKISGNAADQAAALMKQHRFDEARHKLAEALTAKPHDVIALSIAARLEAEDGNLEGAKKAASEALQAEPNGAIANLTQGMVAEMGNNETQAITAYEKAIRADMKLPEAHLLMGNAEMRRGHYSQAAEQYRQLLAAQPENSEADARLAAAQFAAGKCADAIKEITRGLQQKPKDGDLLQLFVRVASTCPAATQDERTKALEYGKTLYEQHPDATSSEALAIAFAAQGKFQDAEDYQAQAIFESVRGNDQVAAAMYKTTMQQIQKKQMIERPWPAQHPYFKPPLLAPGAPDPTSIRPTAAAKG